MLSNDNTLGHLSLSFLYLPKIFFFQKESPWPIKESSARKQEIVYRQSKKKLLILQQFVTIFEVFILCVEMYGLFKPK